MKTFPNPFMESLILEKIKFEYGTEIPPDVIANLTVEQIVDFETRAVKTFFRTFIMGREVREKVISWVIIYHSWWQHFKEACFPKFLKRFFPVQFYRQPVVTKHFHLCPHTGLDFKSHDSIEHFRFLEGVEPDDWMKPFIKIAEDTQFGSEKR
jgi:hypothetical protein